MTARFPRLALTAMLAMCLAIAAEQAHATLITGSASFTDSGPAGNSLNFTGTFSPNSAFSFNATSGTPVTLTNYLRITETDSFAGGFTTVQATDTLGVNFTLTQPSSGSGSVSGTGTYSETFFFGFVVRSDGSIHWNGPATINLAGGDTLKIALSDETFSGSSANVDASFLYTGGSTASVPEPSSIGLFGAGLFALGMFARRSWRDI